MELNNNFEFTTIGASIDYNQILQLMGGIFLIIGIICLITIIELWKIYKKCNKPGWATLVPIYNVWVFLEIGGLPGWLCLIPVANLIGILVAYFKIPKRFGKSAAFGIGILLLPIIFLGILAFSKTKKEEIKEDNEPKTEPETIEVDNNINNKPDLMAEPTEIPNATVAEEPKREEIVESPALDISETIEMPIEANNEPIIPDSSSISTNSTSEINAFEMPLLVDDQSINNPIKEGAQLPVKDEVVEPFNNDIETLELPKMINEEINNDITETKICPNCAHINKYVNKICDICGSPLE